MEVICETNNLVTALRRVKSNRGSPGADGMTARDLEDHFRQHWPMIGEQLLNGTYRPQPLKRVEIPKPDGGVRKRGIPTVLDRFIQQAMLQVLQRDWDQTFSENSDGFRPGRSAHQAITAAQGFIAEGLRRVVDLDLEKFFDRVNHDILMSRIARRVRDVRVRQLIRAFLNAGVLENGLFTATDGGTPQGGPLAPPTKVQTFLFSVFASFLRKKGEVDTVDDSNLRFLDHHTVDQRTQNFATQCPVCLFEIRADRGCEVIQTG